MAEIKLTLTGEQVIALAKKVKPSDFIEISANINDVQDIEFVVNDEKIKEIKSLTPDGREI